MDTFSKMVKDMQKAESKVQDSEFKSKVFDIKKSGIWEYNDEPDTVVIIPHLTDFKEVLMRKEVIPQYNLRDNEKEYMMCITCTIRNDEDLEQAVRRKLEEDCGIMLNPSYKQFECDDSLYKNKNTNSKYHFLYLPIQKTDYMKIRINGDRAEHENMSVPVRITADNLRNVKISDIATSYAVAIFNTLDD